MFRKVKSLARWPEALHLKVSVNPCQLKNGNNFVQREISVSKVFFSFAKIRGLYWTKRWQLVAELMWTSKMYSGGRCIQSFLQYLLICSGHGEQGKKWLEDKCSKISWTLWIVFDRTIADIVFRFHSHLIWILYNFGMYSKFVPYFAFVPCYHHIGIEPVLICLQTKHFHISFYKSGKTSKLLINIFLLETKQILDKATTQFLTDLPPGRFKCYICEK